MNFTQAIDELDRSTEAEARRRLSVRLKSSALGALQRTVLEFFHVYFSQNARKEGVPGLFRAVQAGMFHFIVYAKHWELEKNASHNG